MWDFTFCYHSLNAMKSLSYSKVIKFDMTYDTNLNVLMPFSLDVSSSIPNELLVCDMICSYVIASMGLQVTWSFMLALLDAYALLRKKMLHNPILVSLFVVGDWVRTEHLQSS